MKSRLVDPNSDALTRYSARFSAPTKTASIGFSTAFLPCGLLYGVLAAAISTGCILHGATLALFFALGSLPALAALQWQTGLWTRLGPNGQFVLRRVVPAVAAVALIFRAVK